ncbi:Acyl-protein synthetase, LuxE [Enhygromyxa salina]|uniref:Acyl-protein synthetase, LuxE n=1 Tax=Enhygromyxa salina TaxID=215803 RepID=A0A2S9XZH8_9BACT|nr:long-chain fatty acid--CoA ligase [Enhygromyxa salina]PRP98264.1 Acyl-protein synthetase, LuxE [Enhygromyxa salina]
MTHAAPTSHPVGEESGAAAADAGVRIIDARTAIDGLIFAEDPWYELPLDRQRELGEALIRQALREHLARCPAYRDYYERSGAAEPEAVALADIPLVSTRVFKFADLRSVEPEAVERWYRSSGTSGQPSRVPRDRASLERMVGSVHGSVGLLADWDEDEVAVINLGPGRERVEDVWFQYVMSLIEALYWSESRVPRDEAALDEISSLAQALLADYEHLIVVGPPFHVLDLCEHMERRGVQLQAGERATILTAGGWKRFGGRAIPKPQFRAAVARRFGLASEAQVRDVFNQVELNTVLFECEAHEKHVPPWVHVAARDPETLQPVGFGEEGMMSYLDASCSAYPCFIVTEDVGIVRQGRCACGREGTRVEILRRLESRAAKGCALKMGQIHAKG